MIHNDAGFNATIFMKPMAIDGAQALCFGVYYRDKYDASLTKVTLRGDQFTLDVTPDNSVVEKYDPNPYFDFVKPNHKAGCIVLAPTSSKSIQHPRWEFFFAGVERPLEMRFGSFLRTSSISSMAPH